MDWLYFSKYANQAFTQFLLALLVLGYLVAVPQKTRATRRLVVFFCGLMLTSLSYFMLVSVYVPWRAVFGLAQLIGGTVSVAALVAFAYEFPENHHVRESRIALGIVIGSSLFHFFSLAGTPVIQSYMLLVSGAILGINTLWPVVVLMRKTLLFADGASGRSAWHRLRHPGNRQARALRAFSLLAMVYTLMSGAILLESLGCLSVNFLLMAVVGVNMTFMFGFVLVFLNNAPQPSTLKTKFVGIAVVVLMLTMGDMGFLVLTDFERRFTIDTEKEVVRCEGVLRDGDWAAIPEEVILIRRYSSGGQGTEEIVFERPFEEDRGLHTHYFSNSFTPAVISAMVNYDLSPNLARDRVIRHMSREEMMHVQKVYGFAGLVPDLRQMVFYFVMDGDLFEVHYPARRYMVFMHGYAIKFIGFVFGTTLFAVVALPLFLRGGLDRPLEHLLQGVREVNAGSLTVSVPVYAEDEIGFVARSFNAMVASVREANEKLQAYAHDLEEANRTLEQRVADRTRDLSEKNEDLARTLRDFQAAQQQLILQEKMVSLGHLVAGVAHEINNPIGAVKASADVSMRCAQKMEQEFDRPGSPGEWRENRTFVQALGLLKENTVVILSASDRVASLVESLRNFSRVDEAAFQLVDLREGLESALALIPLPEGARVVRDLDETAPVFCAPGQINQVFYNVLRNAASAIGGSGTIALRTLQNADGVHVYITDDGLGIEPEILDHIFDFRFSHQGARVKMGSGLVAAYDIVQQHGGDIAINSTLDSGTEVKIRLPLRKPGTETR